MPTEPISSETLDEVSQFRILVDLAILRARKAMLFGVIVKD